jgi:hypothetical protein
MPKGTKSLASLMKELLSARICQTSRVTYRKQLLKDLRDESVNKANPLNTRLKIIELILKISREDETPIEKPGKDENPILLPDLHAPKFLMPETHHNEDTDKPAT